MGLRVCIKLNDFDQIIELAMDIAHNGDRIAYLNYVRLHAYARHKVTQDFARLTQDSMHDLVM